MSLRARKKQQTRARILREAQALFLHKGFEHTSMEEIASNAEVSRAGLFNYFSGKKAIIDALAQNLEPRLVQLVEHYRAVPASSQERLLQLFTHAARVVEQTSTLTRLLFVHGSAGADFPELQQALVKLLEQGQRQGDVRMDQPVPLMAESIYLAFVAGLLGWLRTDSHSIADQFVQRAQYLGANLLT